MSIYTIIIDSTYELSGSIWISYTAYSYLNDQQPSYEVFSLVILISFTISVLTYLYIIT